MNASEPSVVLGVSCDFHDSAAALVVDGELVAAAEEERFSRVKHDASLPAQAIESCLAVAGIAASDVDVVAFYERPVDVLARWVAVRRRQGPAGLPAFVRDTPRLAGRNLMVGYRIERVLRTLGSRRAPRFDYVDHHRSHAAAAFFASPFDRAAVLTVDGLGEWATATIGRGWGNQLSLDHELRYPDSIGLVYSFVTAMCGFEPNGDEYKVMGLAPFGRPRFLDSLDAIAPTNDDGSIEVAGRSLGWFGARALRRGRLRDEFGGPPRRPGEPLGEREADLAASVQAFTERAVLRLAQRALDGAGETNLCLGGGVALNCVANRRLLELEGLDELWVQPAAGDAGNAIGAALASWYDSSGASRNPSGGDSMRGAFLGPRAARSEVETWLTESGVAHRLVDDPDDLAAAVADRLAAGDVVGWFQGRMEFGPRALGHRSILADPRGVAVRRHVNDRVKHREDFRPFAPSVLAERAADWFEIDQPAPYMSVVAPVRDASPPDAASADPCDFAAIADSVRSPIPACTHVDGTARLHTVDAAVNPEFHRLLTAFEASTGCPVLLNTSFNVAGMPIVASPADAFDAARAASLDLLVIEHALIEPDAWR